MSWHTSAILLKADYSKDYPSLLKKLGLDGAEPGGVMSFEEASSSHNEGVAVGTVNGWTGVWGMILTMIDDRAVAKLAKKTDVFQMVLEGASDTAGFTWWTGGKRVRDWLRQQGKLFKNDGTPLPQEKKAFTKRDDEQAVLQMLLSLTLPLEQLEAIPYQMFEVSEDLLLEMVSE